jgi:hypothetical protein
MLIANRGQHLYYLLCVSPTMSAAGFRSCKASHLHFASAVPSHVAGFIRRPLDLYYQNFSLRFVIRRLPLCL